MPETSRRSMPPVKVRRKFYSASLFMLSLYAGYQFWISGLTTLLIALLVPVVIIILLWICPFTPPHMLEENPRKTAASEPPPMPIKKRIILFSDGTGNSSGKLFKTNVWRIYQAVDFGYVASGDTMQIGSYNDGVGNSSFKPLAILGGIFGLGLRRNVIHLYRFLCRNYTPGDEIFVFGFSRGAYTVRILTALIADQGVITEYRDERHLNSLSNAAYREFVRANVPGSFPWITKLMRFVRDATTRFFAWLLDPFPQDVSRDMAEIDFVGVWDTVGAYGGPIMEITRGIDRWVAPLSMTDYMLSGKVKMARHALALDDERASFRPLVWDEVHEAEQRIYHGKLIKRLEDEDFGSAEREKLEIEFERVKNFKTDRIKQVWFSGMHADVGGGYPDESLSYVSLMWMIDEIGDRLEFLPSEVERLRKGANIFGPIHNSRQGLGAYYRYQPRKITAFMHHGGDKQEIGCTLSHRDPQVTFPSKSDLVGTPKLKYRGLLTHCSIHSSVLVRIAAGTDNYAPVGLPRTFDVEGALNVLNDKDRRNLDKKIAHLLSSDKIADRAVEQERIWDHVSWRRGIYFASLTLTLLFLAMPLWPASMSGSPTDVDDRWVGGLAANLFTPILPGFAEYWLVEFEQQPIVFLGLLGTILALLVSGGFLERLLRDGSRTMWWSALDNPAQDLKMKSRLRDNYSYQRVLQFLKWSLAPNLLGMAAVVLIAYLSVSIGAQGWMVYAERDGSLCGIEAAENGLVNREYIVDKPCNDTGITIQENETYEIVFVASGQSRSDRDSALFGVSVWNLFTDNDAKKTSGLADRMSLLFGTPFRRIVPARWIQPLYLVRDYSAQSLDVNSERVGDDISMKVVKFETITHNDGETRAIAIIKSPQKGRLFLFANDAGFPGLKGVACRNTPANICDVEISVAIRRLEAG